MIRRSLAALPALLLATVTTHAAEVEIVAPAATGDLRDALRAASLSVTSVNEDVTDGQELLAAAKADYRRMVAALYEEGYFGGTVSIRVDGREASGLSVLRQVPNIGTIRIEVTPGPRYRFGTARIAPLPPGATPAEGFAPGQTATTPVMRRAAEQGVGDWRQAGHAKAEVSGQRIAADHRVREVDAEIDLAPGPRLRFGDTVLTPESARSRVYASRIRAIAGLPEGERFDPDEISQAERRLRRAGAFRSAVVNEAETPNPDGTLDMVIDVEDAKPRRFGFGVELSNIDGVSLHAYWMHRNLLRGSDRFRVDANVDGIAGETGGIDYGITASLTRPAFRHPDNYLRYGINLQHEDEPSYTSDLVEATVGVERYVNEDLTAELDLGYRFSHVTDAFGTRNFNHVIGRAAVIWDRRNDDLDPTSGFFAEADAIPYVGVNGSDTGARFLADLRGYVPLGSDRFSLAGRLQAGSVVGSSLSGTPPDYLFFSGGGGTVRGQDYQSLGGTMVGGQLVGGRSFAALSGEIRAKVSDNIGIVGFVDYGYVSPDADFSGGDWHGGAGIGGRYYTPIGPIRFDVAVPITGENGFGVYVGIGQSF
ncbi:MAG: autotransporter assembly complex protein TamA [Pseudooceanicola sp.]